MLQARNAWQSGNSDEENSGDCRHSSSSLRIKIGVVENDSLMREGLVALLSTIEEFDCIGAWKRPQEALSALQRFRPDVLLLDIGPLQPSSLTLFKGAPSISKAARIFLTMNCPKEWWAALERRQSTSERGATALLSDLLFRVRGAVCEEDGFHWIAENIRKAYIGEHHIDHTTLECLAASYLHWLQFDMTAEKVHAEILTLRERQVMQLIAQGYSNKDIAREMQLGYSTVKNYVSSILSKLQLDGRTQIALWVHQRHEDLRLPLQRQTI